MLLVNRKFKKEGITDIYNHNKGVGSDIVIPRYTLGKEDTFVFPLVRPGQEEQSSSTNSKKFLQKIEIEKQETINSKLTEPWTWSKERYKLERLATRIEDCKSMDWAHVCCKKCGNIVKKESVKLSCLSPFCQNSECIQNKKRIVMKYLRGLRIRSKVLYHFVVGFQPVKKITKELRAEYRKILKSVIKEIEKSHSKLHLIVVGDINKSENGLRYHFHCASLPVKDFRLLASLIQRATQKITEQNNKSGTKKPISQSKTNVGVQLIGYSNKKAIYHYFSKRASGVFGHATDETAFGYPDIMILKDYFDVFYKTKKIFLHNLKVRRGATEFINLLDNLPEKCPYCGHEKFKIIPKNIYKPPPDRICFECGLIVDPRDWDYSLGCCKYCALQKSFSFRKSIELKNKLPEMAKVHKQDYESEVLNFVLSRAIDLNSSEIKC